MMKGVIAALGSQVNVEYQHLRTLIGKAFLKIRRIVQLTERFELAGDEFIMSTMGEGCKHSCGREKGSA